MRAPAAAFVAAPLLALALAGCGGGASTARDHGVLTIAVNAPFTGSAYVGKTIDNGVSLAVAEINASGGIRVGTDTYDMRVRRFDTGLSARRAVQNVRRAVGGHTVAVVDEGTGLDATWRVAQRAGTAVGVVYQGGERLVDPSSRPNVFRIAPTDHGLAFRLAEYLVPKHLRVAIVHDDSDYGTEGAAALRKAFAGDRAAVAAEIAVPAEALDLAPQILRARNSGATALLVWGRAPTIAAALTAARSSGWAVPVYAPPTGSDPFVRQQLASHPTWVDGLTFASGRLTAEVGTQPFETFQANYVHTFGQLQVGVRTKDGKAVVSLPEWATYAYDFTNLVAAAVKRAQSTDPARVTAALNQASIRGANGDERGFNERNHEGVIDDDIYFARFRDMTFTPVQDDPLSATLPTLAQTSEP